MVRVYWWECPTPTMLLHLLLLALADASRKQSLLTPEEEDDMAADEDATLSGDGADDGGGSGGRPHRSDHFLQRLSACWCMYVPVKHFAVPPLHV